MRRFFTYPFSILYGAYFYLIFQLMFVTRFGGINMHFTVLDIFIWLVGVASIAGLMYFMGKLGGRKHLMWIPFVIAVPLGFIGALGGGLLGIFGLLVFGLLPFALILPAGYWLIGRYASPNDESTISAR
jgi:hypothetical protein